MWMLLLALACSGSSDAPKKKEKKPKAAAKAEAPKPPEPPKEAAYADHYFVILSSKLEKGHAPAGLATIQAHPELGLAPERFPSTGFKALMPCYEIVVAAAIKDKAAALDLSTKLKGLGVDNYVKNAGPWTGLRPELDAYCAALGKPIAGDAGVAIVEPGLGALLTIDPAVASPILAAAPALQPLGADNTRWSAALPHQTIGGWSVGQKVAGLGAAGAPLACQIDGFLAGVAGQPHFGWAAEAGAAPKEPGCGSPALYAKLTCTGGDPLLVLAAGRKGAVAEPNPAVAPDAPASTTKIRDPRITWMTKPPAGLAAAKKTAADQAALNGGVKPTYTWKFSGYTLAGANYAVVEHLISSGESWQCGGNDIHERVVGLIGPDGKEYLPVVSAPSDEILGVFDTNDDGKPELLLRDGITGSARLMGATGETLWPRSYCDCAC